MAWFKSTEERFAEIEARQAAERNEEANKLGQETGSQEGILRAYPNNP